jgi:hypothetical protein
MNVRCKLSDGHARQAEPVPDDALHIPLLHVAVSAAAPQEFKIGGQPPRVGGIKGINTSDDEVILEVPLLWGSDCKVGGWRLATCKGCQTPRSTPDAYIHGAPSAPRDALGPVMVMAKSCKHQHMVQAPSPASVTGCRSKQSSRALCKFSQCC